MLGRTVTSHAMHTPNLVSVEQMEPPNKKPICSSFAGPTPMQPATNKNIKIEHVLPVQSRLLWNRLPKEELWTS